MSRPPGSYDSVAELLETLDRQVGFYQGLSDDRLLVGFPQLLSFLESDARQFTLIGELKDESRRALVEFESRGKKLRSFLADLWLEAKPLLQVARAFSDNNEFDSHDDFEVFERNLGSDEEIDGKAYLHRGEPSEDPRLIAGLVSTFHEWLWAGARAHRKAKDTVPDLLRDLDARLTGLKREMTFGYRQYWLEGRVLAGNAYERLRYTANWINPVPRPSSAADGWEHAGHEFLNKDLVEALLCLDPAILRRRAA